jgi:hypothetical protein
MEKTYFTISSDSEHIGTIAAVNEQELHEKVLTALEEHFDSQIEVTVCGEFDFNNIVNCDPSNFKAVVDGNMNVFNIQQTWLY